MKKLKPTDAWILLCSVIVFTSVATEHSSHHNGLPYHRTSTPRRRKIQLPALPVTIQIPEHVMSKEEVSCISADRNIFEIMNQAKYNCKGKDMICTFYFFANHKYYNIGTLEIDKELFDGILMKYDNWLLTAEKFHLRDTEKYLQDRYLKLYEQRPEHKSHMDTTNTKDKLTGHGSFSPTDSSYAPGEGQRSKIDHSFYIDKFDNDMYYYNAVNATDVSNNSDYNRNAIIKENTENRKLNKDYHKTHTKKDNDRTVLNVKEKKGKSGNYIKLEPKYDNAHNYFEVFLPTHEDNAQPKTINVEINNEKKNYLFFEEDIDEKNEHYKPLQIEFKEDTSAVAEFETNLYNNRPPDNAWRFAQSSINDRKNKGNIRYENSNHDKKFGKSDIHTDFSDIPVVDNNENHSYFADNNIMKENETSDTNFNKFLSIDLNTDNVQADRIDNNNPINNMPLVHNLKTYKVTSGNDQEIVIQNNYSKNDYNIKNKYHKKTDIKNAPTEDTYTIVQPIESEFVQHTVSNDQHNAKSAIADIDDINLKKISQEATPQENISDNGLKYMNKYQVYPSSPEDYSTTDNAFSQMEGPYNIDSKIYNLNGNQKIIPGDTTKNGKSIVNFSQNVVVPNKYINQAEYYVESELNNNNEEKIPVVDTLSNISEEISYTSKNNDYIKDFNTNIEQNDQLDTKRNYLSDKKNLQHLEAGNIVDLIKNNIERKSDFNNIETLKTDQSSENKLISQGDGFPNDALNIKSVENPNIYSDMDFDDTHDFSTHKNDILSSSNIYHNEPVHQVEKPFRENIMKSAPYIFTLPKSYSSHPHTKTSAYADLDQELLFSQNQPIATASNGFHSVPNTPLHTRTLIGKEFSKTAEPKSHLESVSSSSLPALVNSLSDLDDSQNSDSPEFGVSPSDSDIRQFTHQILPVPPIESVMRLNIGSKISPFNVGFSWLPSYSRIEELRTPTIPQLESSALMKIPSIGELSADSTSISVSPVNTLIESGLPSFDDGFKESLTNNNLLKTTTPVSQEQTTSALESDLSPFQPLNADSAPLSEQEYATPLSISPFSSRVMNLPNSVQQTLNSPYALPLPKTSPLDLRYLKTLPFDINSYIRPPISNQIQVNNPLSTNINQHPYVTLPQLVQPIINPLPASKISLDSLPLSRLDVTYPQPDKKFYQGEEPIIVPLSVSGTPLVQNLQSHPILELGFLQSSPISHAEPHLLAKIPNYKIRPIPSAAYTIPMEKSLQNFLPLSTVSSDLPQRFKTQQDRILEPTLDKGTVLNEDIFQNILTSYKPSLPKPPSPLSSSTYIPVVEIDSSSPMTSSLDIPDLISQYNIPVPTIPIGSQLLDQDSLVTQSKLSLLPTIPLKVTAQVTPQSNINFLQPSSLEHDNEIIDLNNSEISPATATDPWLREDTQSKQLSESLPSDFTTFLPLESRHTTPQLDLDSTPLLIDSSKQSILSPTVQHITKPLLVQDNLQYTDDDQVSQSNETSSNVQLPSNQLSISPLWNKQQPKKWPLDQPVYTNEIHTGGGSETVLLNEGFHVLSSDANILTESYPKPSPSVESGLELNRKSSLSIEPNLQLPSTVLDTLNSLLIAESLADPRIPSSLYNGPNIGADIPEFVRPIIRLPSLTGEIVPSLVPTTSQLDDPSRISHILNSKSQQPVTDSQHENSITSSSLDSISPQLELNTEFLPSNLIVEELPLDLNIVQSNLPISSLTYASPLLKPILSPITSTRLSTAAEFPTENSYLPTSLLPENSPAILPLPPTLTSPSMSSPFHSINRLLPLSNIRPKEGIPQLSSIKDIPKYLLPSDLISTHLTQMPFISDAIPTELTQMPYISYPHNVPLPQISKLLSLPPDYFSPVLDKSTLLEIAPELLLPYTTPNYSSSPLPSNALVDINPKPLSTPILKFNIPSIDISSLLDENVSQSPGPSPQLSSLSSGIPQYNYPQNGITSELSAVSVLQSGHSPLAPISSTDLEESFPLTDFTYPIDETKPILTAPSSKPLLNIQQSTSNAVPQFDILSSPFSSPDAGSIASPSYTNPILSSKLTVPSYKQALFKNIPQDTLTPLAHSISLPVVDPQLSSIHVPQYNIPILPSLTSAIIQPELTESELLQLSHELLSSIAKTSTVNITPLLSGFTDSQQLSLTTPLDSPVSLLNDTSSESDLYSHLLIPDIHTPSYMKPISKLDYITPSPSLYTAPSNFWSLNNIPQLSRATYAYPSNVASKMSSSKYYPISPLTITDKESFQLSEEPSNIFPKIQHAKVPKTLPHDDFLPYIDKFPELEECLFQPSMLSPSLTSSNLLGHEIFQPDDVIKNHKDSDVSQVIKPNQIKILNPNFSQISPPTVIIPFLKPTHAAIPILSPKIPNLSTYNVPKAFSLGDSILSIEDITAPSNPQLTLHPYKYNYNIPSSDNLPLEDDFLQNIPSNLQHILPTPPCDTNLLLDTESLQNKPNIQYPVSGVKLQPLATKIPLDIVPSPSDINSLLKTDFTQSRPVSQTFPSSPSVYTSPLLERQRPPIKVQKFKPHPLLLPAYNNIPLDSLFSQNLAPLSTYNTPLVETESSYTTQPCSLPLPEGMIVQPAEFSTIVAADGFKNTPDSVYIPSINLESPSRFSKPLLNTDKPLIPKLDAELIDNSNMHNDYPTESSLVYSRPLLKLEAVETTPYTEILANIPKYGIPPESLGPISSNLDIEIIQPSSQLSAMSSQLFPIDISNLIIDLESKPTQLAKNPSVRQYSAPCPISSASNRPLSRDFTSVFSPISTPTSEFIRPLLPAYPIPLSPAYPITVSPPYVRPMPPNYIDSLLPACSYPHTGSLSLHSKNRLTPSYTDLLSPTYFEPIVSAYPSKLSRDPTSQQILVSPSELSPSFTDTLSPLYTSSLLPTCLKPIPKINPNKLSPVPSQQLQPQPTFSGFISQPFPSRFAPIYIDPSSSVPTNAMTCSHASQLTPIYTNPSITPTISPIYKNQQYTIPLTSLASNELLNIQPQIRNPELQITQSLPYATSPFKNINQRPIIISKIQSLALSPVSSSQIIMNDLKEIPAEDILQSNVPSSSVIEPLTSALTHSSSKDNICTENNQIYEDYIEELSLVTPLKSTPSTLVCEEVTRTLLDEDLAQVESQIPSISLPCSPTQLLTPYLPLPGTPLSPPCPTPKSVQLTSTIPVFPPRIYQNMPLEPTTLLPLPVSSTFMDPELQSTIDTNLPSTFQPSSPIRPLDTGLLLSSGRHPIFSKPQTSPSYPAPYSLAPNIDFSKISRNPPIIEYAPRVSLSPNFSSQIDNIDTSQVTPQFSEVPSVAPLSPLYTKPISSTISSPSKTQLTVSDIPENYISLSPTYTKLTSNTPPLQGSLIQSSPISNLNKYQTPFTSPTTKPMLDTFLQNLRKPQSPIYSPYIKASPAFQTLQNAGFSPLIPISLISAPTVSEKSVTLPTSLITRSTESDISESSSKSPDFLTSSSTSILPALSQTLGNGFSRTDGSVPTYPQLLSTPTSQYLLLQESPSLSSSFLSSSTLSPTSAISLSTDQSRLQQTPFLQQVFSTPTSTLSPQDTSLFQTVQDIKPSSINNVLGYSYPSSHIKPKGITDFEQMALKPSLRPVSYTHNIPFSNTIPLVQTEFLKPVKSPTLPVSTFVKIPQSSLVLPFNAPPLETTDLYQPQPIPELSSASSVSYDALSLPLSYTTPSLTTGLHNTIAQQILHRPSISKHISTIPVYDTPVYVPSSLIRPLTYANVKTHPGVSSSSIPRNLISPPNLALSDTKHLLPILQPLDIPEGDVLPDLHSSQIISSAPIHSSSLVKPFTNTVSLQKSSTLESLSPYFEYLPQSLLSDLSPQLPTANVPQLLPLTTFSMKNPVPRPIPSGKLSSTIPYNLPNSIHTTQYQTLVPSISCGSRNMPVSPHLSSTEPSSWLSASPILKSLSTPMVQYDIPQSPPILSPPNTYTSIVPWWNSSKLPSVNVPQNDSSYSKFVTTIPDTVNMSPILLSSYSPSPLPEENIVQEAIPIKVPSISTSKYDISDSSPPAFCTVLDTDTTKLTELNQLITDLLTPLDLSQQRTILPISAQQHYPLPSLPHKVAPLPEELSQSSSINPIFSFPSFSTPSFLPVKTKLIGTADSIPTLPISSKSSISGNSDRICKQSSVSADKTSTYVPTDLFQNTPLSTPSIYSIQSDLSQFSTLNNPQSNIELKPQIDKCGVADLLTSPVLMSTDFLQESFTNQQLKSASNNPQYNILTPLLPPVLSSSPQIISSPNVQQSSTYCRGPLDTSSLISQLMPESSIPKYKFSPLISPSQISPMLARAYTQNQLQIPIIEKRLPFNGNSVEKTPYIESLLQNNLDKCRFPSYIESNNVSPVESEELKSSSEVSVKTNTLEVNSKTITPVESTVYTEYEEKNNLNERIQNYTEYVSESENICLDASSSDDINYEEYINEDYQDIESFNKIANYLFDKSNLKTAFPDLTSTNLEVLNGQGSKANNIDLPLSIDNTIASDFNIDTRIINNILPDIYEEIPEPYPDEVSLAPGGQNNINSLKTLSSTPQLLPSAVCYDPLMDKDFSQTKAIPLYNPFIRNLSDLLTYTPLTPTSTNYNNSPKPTSNIAHFKIFPQNPKSISKQDNFYANKHIGESPQIFSIPTINNINSYSFSKSPPTVSPSSYRVSPGICGDSIGIPTVHFGSPPKTDIPLAPKKYYSRIPDRPTVDPVIPNYHNFNARLESSPQSPLPPNRVATPQIDGDFTKLTPDDSSASSNNMENIKYSGYKTYQIPTLKTSDLYGIPSPPQIYSRTTMTQPLPTMPLYLKTIPNISVKMATPLQTKLGLSDLQQGSISNEYIPIEDIPLCENNIDVMTTPLLTKLSLSNLQQSSKSNEYNPIEDIPVCENSIDLNDELKTSIINYINRNKDVKKKLKDNNNELSIPISNLAITKKVPCNDYTIQTKNPSIDLKVWKSNVKVVEAEIKLKIKDLSVTNFMAVANNSNEYDIKDIRNIVKSYIDEKYGHHIEVNEPYKIDDEYTVIKDFDQNSVDNKYNILWPTYHE